MAPITAANHLADARTSLLQRRNAWGYSIAPAGIVAIVIIAAGFLVIVGFAVGRFYFSSDRSPRQAEMTDSSNNGMSQQQYQRWLRLRTQEDLQRNQYARQQGAAKPLTSSSFSSL